MFSQKPALTLRNESKEPFSMYSTTIITGLPENTHTSCNYTFSVTTTFNLSHQAKSVQVSHKYPFKTKMHFVVSQHWKPTPLQTGWFSAAQAHLQLKCKTILITWRGAYRCYGAKGRKIVEFTLWIYAFSPASLSHGMRKLTDRRQHRGVEYFLLYGTTCKSVQMNGIFNISNL